MNRPESPSTALRAPSPPNGGEGQDEGERFMESLLSLLRTHWDHEPDWHPSPCPLPARRGEGRRRPGERRFMEMEHLPQLDVNRSHEPLTLVGTARCAVRAACSGASVPPAVARAGTSQRDVPNK